jgi:hypothetical protein
MNESKRIVIQDEKILKMTRSEIQDEMGNLRSELKSYPPPTTPIIENGNQSNNHSNDYTGRSRIHKLSFTEYEFGPIELVESLPAGIFKPKRLERGWVLESHATSQTGMGDQYINTGSDITKEILDDVEKFWSLEETYKNAGIVHKRGLLLHGEAGTGKTCIINMLAQDVLKRGGCIVTFEDDDSLWGFLKIVSNFREAKNNQPVMLMFEEIDALESNFGARKAILTILDGLDQLNNVLVVGTTNNINSLSDAIKSRPGRFDRVYRIGFSTREERSIFVNSIAGRIGCANEELINRIIDATDNMSLAMVKEVLLAVHLYGYEVDEIMKHMTYMTSKKDASGNVVKKIGLSAK